MTPESLPTIRRTRTRAAAAALALGLALTAAGCGGSEDTPAAPEPSSGSDALASLTAAAATLAEGVSFEATITTVVETTTLAGREIAADKALELTNDPNGVTRFDVRVIAEDTWVKFNWGDHEKAGWGHTADPLMIRANTGLVGPSVWVPALVAQATTVEATNASRYEGVLDFSAVDPNQTSISSRLLLMMSDAKLAEVPFAAEVDEGSLVRFSYTITKPNWGELEVVYRFADHGAVEPIEAPGDGDEVTELDEDAVQDWLSTMSF